MEGRNTRKSFKFHGWGQKVAPSVQTEMQKFAPYKERENLSCAIQRYDLFTLVRESCVTAFKNAIDSVRCCGHIWWIVQWRISGNSLAAWKPPWWMPMYGTLFQWGSKDVSFLWPQGYDNCCFLSKILTLVNYAKDLENIWSFFYLWLFVASCHARNEEMAFSVEFVSALLAVYVWYLASFEVLFLWRKFFIDWLKSRPQNVWSICLKLLKRHGHLVFVQLCCHVLVPCALWRRLIIDTKHRNIRSWTPKTPLFWLQYPRIVYLFPNH